MNAMLLAAVLFAQVDALPAAPEAITSAAIEKQIAILRAETADLERASQSRIMSREAGDAAAGVLRKIGEPAVAELVKLLKDDKPNVRLNAAWTLQRLDGPQATEAKLAALTHDDPQVRRLAAEGFHDLGDAKPSLALMKLFQDPDARVRASAVAALTFYPESKRKFNQYMFGRIAEALKPVVDDPEMRVRYNTARTLGSLEGHGLAMLERLAFDADRYVRAEAINGLHKIKSKSSLDTLLKATEDSVPQVAGLAAAALGDLEDVRAVPTLLPLVQSKEANLAAPAAEALGKIRDRRAIDPLIEALGHEHEFVRHAAAKSLGSVPDSRSVEPLIAAMHHDREPEWYFEPLCRLNDERAIKPLVAALFSDPPPKYVNTGNAAKKWFPQLRHPRMIQELAERIIAQPKHHSTISARMIVEEIVGRDLSSGNFESWWKVEKTRPCYKL